MIKFIVIAFKWFDSVNGNTYFSCRIFRCRDKKVLYVPFEYGYGDFYRQRALRVMRKSGWIPKKYEGQEYLFERENNYPVFWFEKFGLKRECVAYGEKP